MLIEQPLLRGVYHPRKERKKINQSKEKKIKNSVNENL